METKLKLQQFVCKVRENELEAFSNFKVRDSNRAV